MHDESVLKINRKDAEYIVRMQKMQNNSARLRPWMFAILILLTILYIIVLVYAIQVIHQLANPVGGLPGIAGIGPGFAIGIMIGMSFGLKLLGLIHYWVLVIFPPTRQRELLLRFHGFLVELEMVEVEE